MSIEKLKTHHSNVLGLKINGRLHAEELEAFLPELDMAIKENRKIRLLLDVDKMLGSDLKSEWDVFKFLEKHMENLELIAIVGAHSWTKIMSEVLASSIFVNAETRYFKTGEIDHAWFWVDNAVHPDNVPVRRAYNEEDGLFTKYGSPNYV